MTAQRKKRRWLKPVLVVLLFCAAFVFFLTLDPSIDPEKVHPSLRELKTPYQSLETAHIADGGSVLVKIVGAEGREFYACLPRPMGEQSLYLKKVYLGGYFEEPEAVELEGYPHTGRLIRNILMNRDEPRHYCDIACAELTGRWGDWMIFYWRNLFAPDDYISAP